MTIVELISRIGRWTINDVGEVEINVNSLVPTNTDGENDASRLVPTKFKSIEPPIGPSFGETERIVGSSR